MEVFFDPIFLKHDTGFHPENTKRLELILDSLKGKLKKPQNGERYLDLAHTKEYVEQVKLTSKLGGLLDPDTPVSADTYRAACFAVGAAIDASESKGFALVRPPGHHAFSDRGSGFCIFNNMAIAAMRQAKKGNKIFILDIDIHHGNGTEEIVLGKENIEFLSIHQSPMYPGTGLKDRGDNVFNIPLPPQTEDSKYISVLDEIVIPKIEAFDPYLVGVSVGFDAYYLDRGYVAGNSFNLTDKTYTHINKIIKPYKTFFVLEGGYHPKSILQGSNALMDL